MQIYLNIYLESQNKFGWEGFRRWSGSNTPPSRTSIRFRWGWSLRQR